MQQAIFTAHCPYELGDIVEVAIIEGMHHIVYAADLIPCGNNEQRQAYANGTRYPGTKG